MGYSKEIVIQIWDDDSGSRVEVGEDPDGLGLVEIRAVEDDGKTWARISMPAEQAVEFHKALGQYLELRR